MPQSAVSKISPPGRRRLLVAATLLVLLGAFAVGAAEEPTTTEATREEGASAGTDGKAPVCVHGCQRWGKFCNVDPRGVYKCRRRCEKFGEICE